MAFVLSDRIKETTTTTSTGTYTLGGAVSGFETFTANLSNGDTTYYCCTDGTDFEVGLGTFTSSGTTLARTTIISSSNSNNAVNWSSGSRDIFCTLPGSKAIAKDGNGDVILADDEEIKIGTGGDLRIFHNGTNSIIRDDNGFLLHTGNGSKDVVVTGNGTFVSTKLKVSGSRTGTGGVVSAIQLVNRGGNAGVTDDEGSFDLEAWRVSTDNEPDLLLRTAGTLTHRFSSTGNVSLGVADFNTINERLVVIGNILAKSSTGSILKLQTSDTTVADGDTIGAIEFSAPDEASGTDAVLTAASIVAEADATFAADNNQTDMVFKLGSSAAATEKMRLTHQGNLELSGNISGTLSTAAQPNITSLGTLTTLTVDDITINGSTISDSGALSIESGAAITLDAVGDIILDAAGNDIKFKDNGTEFLRIANSSSDAIIRPVADTKDIIFQQRDGTEVARVEDNGTFNIVTDKLAINGTAITSTAAEINKLDGVTATTTELNYVDVSTAGTVEASKAVVVDSDKDISGFRVLTTQKNYVTATDDVSASSTAHPFQIGSTSSTNIAMDSNEIMARNNGSISNLKINDGALQVGSSDITLSGNIELGHASDTTIARASAGVVTIEGNTIITTGNSDTPSTTTSSSDADFVLVDDGGTMKKITPANLGITSGGASKGFAVAMAIAL